MISIRAPKVPFNFNFKIEMGKDILIRAPKVPFNVHVKSGMENDIFFYFNFDSKLKIEKFLSFFNFQF